MNGWKYHDREIQGLNMLTIHYLSTRAREGSRQKSLQEHYEVCGVQKVKGITENEGFLLFY